MLKTPGLGDFRTSISPAEHSSREAAFPVGQDQYWTPGSRLKVMCHLLQCFLVHKLTL